LPPSKFRSPSQLQQLNGNPCMKGEESNEEKKEEEKDEEKKEEEERKRKEEGQDKNEKQDEKEKMEYERQDEGQNENEKQEENEKQDKEQDENEERQNKEEKEEEEKEVEKGEGKEACPPLNLGHPPPPRQQQFTRNPRAREEGERWNITPPRKTVGISLARGEDQSMPAQGEHANLDKLAEGMPAQGELVENKPEADMPALSMLVGYEYLDFWFADSNSFVEFD
jgi:hypothetical protein